jgi:outer membrane protein OmpA-like peptidoglycan-associated protein
VRVEGFTDSQGSDDYNYTLSERRAAAVQRALIDQGIAPDRVEARGYGESFPVASNDSAAGRQLNRRVEVVISEAGGKIVPTRR